MQVLAFISKMEGYGASTLACHVSVQAQLTGHGPVALCALGSDNALTAWAGLRQARYPEFMETTLPTLGSILDTFDRGGSRLAVVDCAAEDDDMLYRMSGAADLIVIPTRADKASLEHAAHCASFAEQQKRPFIFVINDASQDAEAIGDAAMFLAQHGTVSPVIIPHNDDLHSSMRLGQTIVEVSEDSPAASEIGRLWDYLLSRLDRVPRQATHSFRASLPDLPVPAEEEEQNSLPVQVLHQATQITSAVVRTLPVPVEQAKDLLRDMATTPFVRATVRTFKAQRPSVIGPSAEITGNLESTGDIKFHAHYEGEIRSRTLKIFKGASIRGMIIADAVKIEGSVRGRIRASKVILTSSARVSGEVLYEKLVVHKGAVIDGHCRRVDSVPALAQIKALESA